MIYYRRKWVDREDGRVADPLWCLSKDEFDEIYREHADAIGWSMEWEAMEWLAPTPLVQVDKSGVLAGEI